MSSQSPQERAAGEQAAWQAGLAQDLSGIAIPELTQILGGPTYVPGPQITDPDTGRVRRLPGHYVQTPGSLQSLLASRDASGMMAPDRANLNAATAELNQGYARAGFGSRASIGYNALRSGLSRSAPGAAGAAIRNAATGLQRDQAQAQANLNMMSAQSSMQDFNKVLQLLGQGANTSLSLSTGFGGAAGQAIAGLSNQSQLGSTLGGASTGAALGNTVYPGWGALIGGAIGAGAGYLSSS